MKALSVAYYPPISTRSRCQVVGCLIITAGIMPIDDRAEYLSTLDHPSIESDIRPSASFIAGQVRWSMEGRKP
jgi:hypothetical protein